MKKNLLEINGIKVLSRESQRSIKGQATIDLSICGCSCSGSVTGPSYCNKYFACIQVYTCEETS